MKIALSEIAKRIGAVIDGDPGVTIQGVAALENADETQLTFAENQSYLDKAARVRAGAIVVGESIRKTPGITLLRVEQPRLAFLRVMDMFVPVRAGGGIHQRAEIGGHTVLGNDVTVEAYAVVDEGAEIGSGTRIGAGSYIGLGARVGENCVIGPHVSILHGVTLQDRVIVQAGSVIGGDGFGYQWLGDHHHKIPQLGTVIVEDDVEIGCNACIDRATLGQTRIRRGTKIDNLVQVAHNNDIGEDVVLTAQIGIAGSVTVGNGVLIGGQVAITDHVSIGSGARIGARSGVSKSVPAGETVLGTPARPIREAKREFAAIGRLPELRKRVQAQEEQLRALSQRIQELESRGD